MCKISISPSILSGNFVNMQDSVKNLEEWGADLIHCDVMDGVYVNNITFGMPMIGAIRKITDMTLDVHLMITKPEKYIQSFLDNGADIITFHPDASDEPLKALQLIKSCKKKCGIVLNPNIPLKPYESLLKYCDILLIMGVYAGFGGQKFIPQTLDKIKEAKNYINDNGLDVEIEIDGGVTLENVAQIKAAGATMIVAGSAVFGAECPKTAIKMLRD